MFDTLTPRSKPGDFETMARARSDPGGFLPEARTGAREAAAHMKDLAERFAETVEHGLPPRLDALGERDLARPGEKRRASHLPQVHSHRIAGKPDVVSARPGYSGGRSRFRTPFLDAGLRFLALGDGDTQLGQHRHRVFDPIGAGLAWRQRLVQFVMGDVAALPPAREHLCNRCSREIEDRPVGRLLVSLCSRPPLDLIRRHHVRSARDRYRFDSSTTIRPWPRLTK